MVDCHCMIPNGIYVRCGLEYLADELTGGLPGLKKFEGAESSLPESPASMRRAIVFLYPRENGWCHVQMSGYQEAIGLVTRFLTDHESFEEVLFWDSNDDMTAYSYSFLREGKVLEQLTVTGPAFDAVSFNSELRRVQLKDLIDAREFTSSTLERFGMNVDAGSGGEAKEIKLELVLSRRKSILKSLLGILAGGEGE